MENEQLKILGSSELKSHCRFLCTDQHAKSNTEPPVGDYIISKTRILVTFRKKNQIYHKVYNINASSNNWNNRWSFGGYLLK